MTDREAVLEGLIQNEWPKLRRYFRTLVPESDVLDLVQNTMLAYVESSGPREPGKERAYLWGIAWKQTLRFYEKNKRKNVPFDSTIHTAMDLGHTVSSRLDKQNRLAGALHAIPVQQQSAVLLRHCEDLKLEEVAEALDVSLATVKRYLSAAEDSLRLELGSLDGIGKEYERL